MLDINSIPEELREEEFVMALNAFEALKTNKTFLRMLAQREEEERERLALINQAKREGIRESKIQTAKRLLAKGLKPDFIAEVTGLSEDEIKALIPV